MLVAMPKFKPKKNTKVRNRIVELRQALPRDVQGHPLNWREHEDHQKRALDDMLAQVGYVKPVDVYIPQPDDDLVTAGVEIGGVVYKLEAGKPCLMDGHLRLDRVPADFMLSLNVTDLTEREAMLYLAVADPMSAMAGQDDERFARVLAATDTDSAAIQAALAKLYKEDKGEDDGDEEGGDGKFQIVVTCEDEDQQRALVEDFTSRGLNFRALVA